MKLLDLFCCCGGISKGFHNKGWQCTGVDIKDGHQYPYKFIQSDVFELHLDFFQQFDLIHASPPCQHYFYGIKEEFRQRHPDLVDKTRRLLLKTHKPFTLENIPNSPLRKDLILCGEMFGLRVIRHRIFEIHGFTVLQPPHQKHKIHTYDGSAICVYSGTKPGLWGKRSYYAQVAGHGGQSYSYKLEDWKEAMGIDWVDKRKHLTQMIPPKYAEYIAQFVSS
jgi:DNA (cytosine-5)-methyltransferase 1